MQGCNQLRLNTATMMQVVQEWVDRQFKDKPVVSHVDWDAGSQTFKVKLDSVPDCDAPPPSSGD